MINQSLIDNILTTGVLPSDAQPGGWKELWAVMTAEERDEMTRVHFGVSYGTPITASMDLSLPENAHKRIKKL